MHSLSRLRRDRWCKRGVEESGRLLGAMGWVWDEELREVRWVDCPSVQLFVTGPFSQDWLLFAS